MKIAILSRNTKLYSTKRLVEAAKQRGHEAVVYDTLKCYIEVTTMRPGVKYKGERLIDVDAVIPRIGASITMYGMAVVRQFDPAINCGLCNSCHAKASGYLYPDLHMM